jgi:NAD(P)H-hydrate epimerase
MRTGAGLVTLAAAGSIQPVIASKLTEATYLPLPESSPGVISPEAADMLAGEIGNYDVLLMGCGLGQNLPTVDFIKSLLLERELSLPRLVLDADALNTLAGVSGWWRRLKDDAILTPHLGEMSRLTGLSLFDVKSDWTGVAAKTAAEWNKTVVLKGAYTAVAAPDGSLRIKRITNPGLASAGTGDVLAGAVAGLAAQGLSLKYAAACGVYLHGEAGEIVREVAGDAGMIASDLLPVLPQAIKRLKETNI